MAADSEGPTEGTSQCSTSWALDLLKKSKVAVSSTRDVLEDAREISEGAGLSIETSILASNFQKPLIPSGAESSPKQNLLAFTPILSTTGGYSNVDHVVQSSGDIRADRLAEFKRALRRRARAELPEQRGEERWDLPRIPGGRRRRIIREIDQPLAPFEPPLNGYVLFISHMTTKVRHDRPNVHHNQPIVVKEISKIWSNTMSEKDQQYYARFAREAQDEYKKQYREFRATGAYRKSRKFKKLADGKGPWVRICREDSNCLEREIAGYDKLVFPVRPTTASKPAWEKEREEAAVRRLQREVGDKHSG